MARGLVVRIFDELIALGALKPGDLVCDPFAGIGSTLIEASSRGMRSIGCELEPKFVALARENIELHRRTWEAMERPIPVMVQGDSRKLRQHVGRVLAAAVVASPPYSVEQIGGGGAKREDKVLRAMMDGYGDTEGQLGAMPSGDVSAIIASPPYAEIASGAGGLNTKLAKDGQQGGRSPQSASQDTDQRYGESAGQLARLPHGDVDAIVCSPPYSTGDSASAQSISTRTDKSAAWVKANCGSAATEGYGLTPGQLGEMPVGAVDAVVSSPPYMVSDQRMKSSDDAASFHRADGSPAGLGRSVGHTYGDENPSCGRMGGDRKGTKAVAERTARVESIKNLGQIVGVGEHGLINLETFWTAAHAIIRESHAALRPGGYAVWVVKHFVRKGQLVDFPGDWRKLCEHVGFELVQEVHASLVETWEENHLFHGVQQKERKRASFFRRLAEKKGSPKIDHETVWFMRKPVLIAGSASLGTEAR